MKVKIPFALFAIIVFFRPFDAVAKGSFESPDTEFLIRACQAVTEIYNAHDEKRFLASQRTSLSDAMRAGYCLGMMEQFQCGFRGKYSLFEGARRVATLSADKSVHQRQPIERLIQTSVCH